MHMHQKGHHHHGHLHAPARYESSSDDQSSTSENVKVLYDTWSMEEVREYAEAKKGRCVIVVKGFVVDVTGYLGEHVRYFPFFACHLPYWLCADMFIVRSLVVPCFFVNTPFGRPPKPTVSPTRLLMTLSCGGRPLGHLTVA